MKSPKKPKETAEERALRDRQARALDATQEKENRQRKMIAFGRLGTRQLLSGSAMGILDEGGARRQIGGTRAGRGAAGAPGGSSRTKPNRPPAGMAPPGSGGSGIF
jgi:hypothetical protein